MAVYVDDMRAKFGRMIMCHMVADTLEELHAMADRIGVARNHYQGPPKTRHPHYDIALSKRAMAVGFGAQEIRWRDAPAIARKCLAAELPTAADVVDFNPMNIESGNRIPIRIALLFE